MNLITHPLEFKELRPRKWTRRIILHHSASADVPADEIHRWHLGKGWAGIGYHFIIRQSGAIEQGRPLNIIGAHAGPEGNSDSIAICLTGDFTRQRPTVKQIAALLQLIPWLQQIYINDLDILRHCDLAATECPGQFFPWDDVLTALADTICWKQKLMVRAFEEGLVLEKHQPDEPSPKWFAAALVLNLMDRMNITK